MNTNCTRLQTVIPLAVIGLALLPVLGRPSGSFAQTDESITAGAIVSPEEPIAATFSATAARETTEQRSVDATTEHPDAAAKTAAAPYGKAKVRSELQDPYRPAQDPYRQVGVQNPYRPVESPDRSAKDRRKNPSPFGTAPDGGANDARRATQDPFGGVRDALGEFDAVQYAKPKKPVSSADIIPLGMRVVSVDVGDAISGILKPGDRVDVLATRQVKESGITKFRTATLLQSVTVFSVSHSQEQGERGSSRAALLVKSEQVDPLLQAKELGRVHLAIVHAKQRTSPPKLAAARQPQHAQILKVSNGKYVLEMLENTTAVVVMEAPYTSISFHENLLRVQETGDNSLLIKPLRKGITSLIFLNNNKLACTVEVIVRGDTRQLDYFVRRLFPQASVEAIAIQDSVMLRGTAPSAAQADQIIKVAEQFYPAVLNNMRIPTPRTATDELASEADPFATDVQQMQQQMQSLQWPLKQRLQQAASAGAGPQSQQLRKMRQDIQLLRRDVNRLIDLLERNHTEPDAAADPVNDSTQLDIPAQGLLVFTAPWCSPCQKVIPTIHKLQAEKLPVIQVDVERHPQLAQQHNIQKIPTFVLRAKHDEIARVEGITSEAAIRTLLSRLR